MPFKSDKQKRWMYANKPEMAKEWSAKEDNESYEHKTDALVAAGGTKSEDIDKIDLSKWKEYPAEDVMKAVYRQYGKELPSVDSYDWAISWDKKVRPWLKKKFNESYINKDMDNEFDKQASQILTENVDDISAERWSEEWDFDDFPPQLNQAIKEFENYLANMEDASLHDLKDIVDEIVAANVLDDDVKEQAIGYLKQRAEASHLAEEELYGEEGIFSDVDDPPYVPEWEF